MELVAESRDICDKTHSLIYEDSNLQTNHQLKFVYVYDPGPLCAVDLVIFSIIVGRK